jgi:hypothetical protein
MPNTETRPENPETPTSKHRLRLPHFGLSATQLIAAALAAITATVAGSYLGVSGTVVGAAVASVLTAIGNAVYGQSLRSTRDRVLVPVTRHIPGVPTVTTTVALPTTSGAAPMRRPRPSSVPPTLPAPRPRSSRFAPWRRAAFGAIGVFVVIMAVVTGVELVAGRPVSDIARGDSGGGTSVFGAHTVTTRTVSPATTPTVTVTVTPKVVVTTPTVTKAAPTVTRTSSGTATATVSPSATSTSTPTPSDTPSGTATPSGSATP